MFLVQMPSVYSHSDYRTYLREWFQAQKALRPVVSYRWIGQKLFADPSLLAKIIAGERHLSSERIQPLVDLLGLVGLEAEYFRVLVQYGKAKTAKDAQMCFSRLAELRRVAPVPLEDSQTEFWDSWIHVAIRALVSCGSFSDEFELMGDRLHPRISGSQVRKAMGTLAQLGFIERDSRGIWTVREPFLRDGSPQQARALRHFHRQTLLLAAESVEGMPRGLRDLSSVTVSIPEEGYGEICEMVRDFRSRVLTAVSRMRSPDRVYQLGIQLVPLALPPEVGRAVGID